MTSIDTGAALPVPSFVVDFSGGVSHPATGTSVSLSGTVNLLADAGPKAHASLAQAVVLQAADALHGSGADVPPERIDVQLL